MKLRRIALICGISIIIIVSVITVYLYKDYHYFKQTPITPSEEVVFEIDRGQSLQSIVNQLEKLQIIDNAFYFKLLAKEKGLTRKIQSGEYLIQQALLPEELLILFTSGKVIQYSLTLVEGWHIWETMNIVKQDPVLIKTLDYTQPDTLMTQLGLEQQVAEGLFFPDTYYFPRGTTDKEFFLRAYESLQNILSEEWENRSENVPYQSAYEALIMASIIEKETGLASERDEIAGVFIRRLQKNMKLQTDPTVIYAIGEQFDGNIRKKDLSIDSPYNTYRYRGLPPTPISLVGREAIFAALHPKDGKWLYFVAKGDGSHYFSETLAEHNRAVAKYQLKAK
ncbi:MAG: endolytic transglycosylase MltG [Pseudomonadota bacterium]